MTVFASNSCPSLAQVCENDIVEVEVKNALTTSEGVSIHWHGVHQVGTPYMDGVASVTQCLVPTHSSFTYRFKASPAGTQFWHSHSGVQRADGLAGNLVIRQKDDPHASLYDFDLKEHEVLIFDWTKETTLEKFIGHHHAGKDNKAASILINGEAQSVKKSPKWTSEVTNSVQRPSMNRFLRKN